MGSVPPEGAVALGSSLNTQGQRGIFRTVPGSKGCCDRKWIPSCGGFVEGIFAISIWTVASDFLSRWGLFSVRLL